ncbi:MAG: SusC/RagA family TonB-linked outer membrane protein [Candidatus Cryptobacteroides sp.]
MKRLLTAITLFAASLLAFAQNSVKVSGKLIDSTETPLIGVAVIIDGTDQGTYTDLEGKFVIDVPSSESVLRFEALGYKTLRMKVGTQTWMLITLADDVSFLDEVVVIGFGETKKSDLTGSVTNVKMADVENSVVSSVDQALQGKIAGAEITSVSGDPTAGTTIRIRGSRSINASNEPLIVVDGVMNAVSDLGDINSADIESVTVLKDASSTAIYGAQGANGVIIVTLKKGADSGTRPVITFTSRAGASMLARKLDLMTASEFAQYNNERVDFARSLSLGDVYPDTIPYMQKYLDPASLGKGTDWQDAITRTAPFQQYALSVSGAGKKTNYFASIGYLDNEGVIIDSGMKRWTGQFTISHKVFDWLRLSYNMNAMYRKNLNNKAVIGGTDQWSGVIYMSPALDITSTINDLYDYGKGKKFNNPYICIEQMTNYRENFSTNHSLTLEFTPIAGLSIKSQNSFYLYGSHLYRFNPSTLPAKNSGDGGDAYRNEHDTRQLSSDNTVTYKKKFDGGHNFDAMAGFSVYYNNQNDLLATAKGILNDDLKWNDLSAISDKQNYTLTSNNVKVKRMSVLGRVNYNYKNRYFITATGRADGSSNFAKNRKWGFFPSAAFKWTISNEQWLKQTHAFQDLSLRVSAGRTGNDAISSYSSLQALDSSASGYILGGTQSTYTYPLRLSSPDLTWETTDQINVGLDVAVLKGRLKLTVDAYFSRTKDLLLSVQQASQSGYTSYTENLGRTSNKGVEISLESKNIVKKNFSWTTELTLSHNRQMVEDIGSEDFVDVLTFKGYRMYGYVKGYPLNSLWGFKYAGVWHNAQEIEENKTTHSYVDYYAEHHPGRPKYVDQDNNGVLDNNDLVYLGNSDPVLFGGFQNNFHIFGFNVGLYFTYSIGGKIYNYPELYMSGTYMTNQYRYMLNAWHPVRNPESDYPVAGGAGSGHLPSDFVVHDASYLRLKTASISYTFDFRKGPVRALTLGVNADNLWLWTRYNGFDPDVSSEGSSSVLRRVDLGSYPRARKIVGMVQIKF